MREEEEAITEEVEADLRRVHALLEQGVTPFFEWLAYMRERETETPVAGGDEYANLVSLYLSAALAHETMVAPLDAGEPGAPGYVIDYCWSGARQVIPLPRAFGLILDCLGVFWMCQPAPPGRLGPRCPIGEVAVWLQGRRDMQDLRLLSQEGYFGVRVRQRPGLVRNMWFVEYANLDGEWALYYRRRRHRLEVAHQYKRPIWALKFARAEVEKRRPPGGAMGGRGSGP